jgi:hypothetical protein
MKTYKAAGLVVLIFVAGFAGGVIVTRIFYRHLVEYYVAHPNQTRTNIEMSFDMRLNRRLDLNLRQREEVRKVLRDARDKMREVREEFQPKMNTISLEARTNIYDLLKPNQQDRFAAFLEENRQFLAVRELPPLRQTNAPPAFGQPLEK